MPKYCLGHGVSNKEVDLGCFYSTIKERIETCYEIDGKSLIKNFVAKIEPKGTVIVSKEKHTSLSRGDLVQFEYKNYSGKMVFPDGIGMVKFVKGVPGDEVVFKVVRLSHFFVSV